MHKTGSKLCDTIHECTTLQKAFLQLMAIDDLKREKEFDIKLTALCESQGIKFR